MDFCPAPFFLFLHVISFKGQFTQITQTDYLWSHRVMQTVRFYLLLGYPSLRFLLLALYNGEDTAVQFF